MTWLRKRNIYIKEYTKDRIGSAENWNQIPLHRILELVQLVRGIQQYGSNKEKSLNEVELDVMYNIIIVGSFPAGSIISESKGG